MSLPWPWPVASSPARLPPPDAHRDQRAAPQRRRRRRMRPRRWARCQNRSAEQGAAGTRRPQRQCPGGGGRILPGVKDLRECGAGCASSGEHVGAAASGCRRPVSGCHLSSLSAAQAVSATSPPRLLLGSCATQHERLGRSGRRRLPRAPSSCAAGSIRRGALRLSSSHRKFAPAEVCPAGGEGRARPSRCSPGAPMAHQLKTGEGEQGRICKKSKTRGTVTPVTRGPRSACMK